MSRDLLLNLLNVMADKCVKPFYDFLQILSICSLLAGPRLSLSFFSLAVFRDTSQLSVPLEARGYSNT